ncbi:bifunctional 4-hydroxy-2-oxoglutarate aldolase/2-dehydro-3-deoxy-phosphogluconate aldolase [bacterium]|nr:MAG: bifunctional 4-hydroxy-2-oxoglutarate aldolase/2-dehydro-3-deoxy-phosphogluconate aldolase [bacterium]
MITSLHPISTTLIKNKAVAVIRLDSDKTAYDVCKAVYDGGIKSIEITLTTPNALAIIDECRNKLPDDAIIGAGSVLNKEMAINSIHAGAQFIVSPVFDAKAVEASISMDTPFYSGAFTPTEAYTAWQAGCDIIKIFPADVVGMAFFKAVKAPIPNILLMPTGGVSLTNAGEWIKSGACAVGVGSALVSKKMVEEKDWNQVKANAKILLNSIFG